MSRRRPKKKPSRKVPILDADKVKTVKAPAPKPAESPTPMSSKLTYEPEEVLDIIKGVVFQFGGVFFKIREIDKDNCEFTACVVTEEHELNQIRSRQSINSLQ